MAATHRPPLNSNELVFRKFPKWRATSRKNWKIYYIKVSTKLNKLFGEMNDWNPRVKNWAPLVSLQEAVLFVETIRPKKANAESIFASSYASLLPLKKEDTPTNKSLSPIKMKISTSNAPPSAWHSGVSTHVWDVTMRAAHLTQECWNVVHTQTTPTVMLSCFWTHWVSDFSKVSSVTILTRSPRISKCEWLPKFLGNILHHPLHCQLPGCFKFRFFGSTLLMDDHGALLIDLEKNFTFGTYRKIKDFWL